MPYTEAQILALSADNFDFSNFDWRRARADLIATFKEGSSWRTRALHVTYSLARGRLIQGPRGIESPNTVTPIRVTEIQQILELYRQQEESNAVAA